MKKFFTFAITALAMIAVFSSCKKEEYTDEALINNIATNALYTGKCVWNYSNGTKEEDKVAVTFTSTTALGKVAVVTFESGMLSGDGVWDVKSAVLSLSWKGVISKDVISNLLLTGTITGNGDKFTLTSTSEKGDVTTMELKKK